MTFASIRAQPLGILGDALVATTRGPCSLRTVLRAWPAVLVRAASNRVSTAVLSQGGTPASRFASLRSRRVPWLGAHVPKGCRVEDSRTRHQRSDTLSVAGLRTAGYPSSPLAPVCWVGSRIAPTAIMERDRHGTARVKASRFAPLASSTLTRTAPHLRAAAIGAMREVCPFVPVDT